MIFLFTTIAIIACLVIGALFAFSIQSDKGGFVWYVRFRQKADRKVVSSLGRIHHYTHANRGVYKHRLSQKSKLFLLALLKKIYIGLQYIVRFVRRNIILTAKKVQNSEPNEMLQELRKERDRIMKDK